MSVTAGGGASPLTNQARRKTPVSVRRRALVLDRELFYVHGQILTTELRRPFSSRTISCWR